MVKSLDDLVQPSKDDIIENLKKRIPLHYNKKVKRS